MTPHRDMFWLIENVGIFYLLSGVAAALFLAGVAAYVRVWKRNGGDWTIPFSKEALKRAFLDTILGKRLLHGHVAAGLMHLLIFWGFFVLFIGTALLFIHDYLYSFLTGTPYLVFSLAMEAGGLVLIAGQDFFGPSSVDTSNGCPDLKGDLRMP